MVKMTYNYGQTARPFMYKKTKKAIGYFAQFASSIQFKLELGGVRLDTWKPETWTYWTTERIERKNALVDEMHRAAACF